MKRTSRLLSILLALCMALALCPGVANAAAEEIIDSGKFGADGDNLTWTMTGDPYEYSYTLTIQGTGDMADYYTESSETVPWADYSMAIQTVKIGNGVTNIGGDAFANCYILDTVDIPDSVIWIAGWAFWECESLTSVTIPASVTYIGQEAFQCRNLTNINVASGNSAYVSVDGILFNADKTLLHTYPEGRIDTSYSIPASVTSIGYGAFSHCENLTNVDIPSSVTSIEGEAFNGCLNLASVTIPASVTSIESYTFDLCENLTDVYYGGSESQWKQIKIDNSSNDPLLAATVHYNSTGPAPSTTPSTSAAISVTVGGKAVAWTDAEPFIDENSRTMVPLRAVADAMGLDVTWDAGEREAVFAGESKLIAFPIDSTTARVSEGEPVTMDTAAIIRDGRTYAPIRYLAEFFGYSVDWDAAARTVVIT